GTLADVVDQLEIAHGLRILGRYLNNLWKARRIPTARGVTTDVASVRRQYGYREAIVRQHLARHIRNATDQLFELSSVGERCQQLVKQIELGGVRFEQLALAGLFGQPVMRHGERDVAGDSLGDRKISL